MCIVQLDRVCDWSVDHWELLYVCSTMLHRHFDWFWNVSIDGTWLVFVFHWFSLIWFYLHKCIGDSLKAATRQSLNCIKNKKNKMWQKTIFNIADGILTPCNVAQLWHWFHQVTAPCSVACSSGIVTVNSPSGSTLQCDTWLWDDMPLNSPGGSTLQCDT